MSTALQILYHDKQVVPYRRELRPLLGSVNATILFLAVVEQHHRHNSGGETAPFAMFRSPAPEHPRYAHGRSWMELLHFSPREFDTAIRKIGTKISLRKSDPRQVMTVALKNADVRGLVVYWTGRDRVTWHQLNVTLAHFAAQFSQRIPWPEALQWDRETIRMQFRDFVLSGLTQSNHPAFL